MFIIINCALAVVIWEDSFLHVILIIYYKPCYVIYRPFSDVFSAHLSLRVYFTAHRTTRVSTTTILYIIILHYTLLSSFRTKPSALLPPYQACPRPCKQQIQINSRCLYIYIYMQRTETIVKYRRARAYSIKGIRAHSTHPYSAHRGNLKALLKASGRLMAQSTV